MIPRDRALSLLSPIALLLAWEGAVALGWLNRIFYPPPSEVLVTLADLAASGQLARDVGISLLRVIAGFLLGAVPAIAIGILMGIAAPVRAAVRPLAAAIYPIPKIALLPLIIVSLGIGEASKIATIAVSVFFLVVLNVAASVMQVDPRAFEVARSFGARARELFWTVALPGSMPGIMASIKLGVGYALTLIVGIEFVGANDGIGRLIWQSYEVYAIDRMVAALIAVALIGWLATVALDEAEYVLVPWQATSVRIRETRMQHYARTWWRAMRPWSYTAAIVPVLLGSGIAAAAGTVDLWLLLLTLIGSVAIQGGTNLVNDYYDYQKGTDQPGSIGTGDALLQGALTPRQVLIGGIAAFGVGASIGLYLVSVSGPLILWIGIISVAVGFFYTAGPFALAYHGLGELAVFIFMGPMIVVGAYYVQRRDAPLGVILAALPVGLLVAAILHANNLRDLDGDRRSGKRTLATILGREGARIELYALLIGAYVALVALVAAGVAPWPTLLGLVTLPVAVRLMRIAAAESEPGRLQPIVPLAAQLHLQTGVLMVAGWLLALVLPRT